MYEIRSKLESISNTFEKINVDISFIFNSIEAVKLGSDSEDEEDDSVYVEDDISDGDIQEGDNNRRQYVYLLTTRLNHWTVLIRLISTSATRPKLPQGV